MGPLRGWASGALSLFNEVGLNVVKITIKRPEDKDGRWRWHAETVDRRGRTNGKVIRAVKNFWDKNRAWANKVAIPRRNNFHQRIQSLLEFIVMTTDSTELLRIVEMRKDDETLLKVGRRNVNSHHCSNIGDWWTEEITLWLEWRMWRWITKR